MIRIHDITYRDYGARITECVGNEKFTTPFMIDYIHASSAPFTLPQRVVPIFLKDYIPEMYDFLISKFPQNIGNLETLAGLRGVEKDPEKFVKAIIEHKLKSGFSKLLYTPYLATPENASILIYLGVDIIDNLVGIVEGYRGYYLTADGAFNVKSLDSLPCKCPECVSSTPTELGKDPESLYKHNTYVLEKELETVRFHIKRGTIRQYVEKQCRSNPYLTALLRIADRYYYKFFEERTPVYKKAIIYPTSQESYYRVEIRRFLERATEIHKGEDVLLLLPCSARKPYLLSKTHQIIRRALPRVVSEIIISSPLVVPRELEVVYPAMHYDTPVTGDWSSDEIEFVASYLAKMIEGRKYSKIIAHVSGGYRKVVERVGEYLNLEVIYTAGDNPLDKKSLDMLAEVVGEGKSVNQFRLLLEGVLNYQFGKGTSELIEGKVSWKGRYPKLTFFENNIQIGVINPKIGSISISKEFVWKLLNAERKVVEIEDFIPKGTIFAKGVVNADENIRPEDEIVFFNEHCYGVGRAVMSGREMMEMDSGTAVKVRHVIKETLDSHIS